MPEVVRSAYLFIVLGVVACSGTRGPTTLDHAALQVGVDSAADRLLASTAQQCLGLTHGPAGRRCHADAAE
ncbi:MAG TPA: hypothetical protein VJ808_03620 [Gemmatimonadales bacterium]|nr:hypothetical protein [Gemmatimonadales bacterium]